MLSNSLKRANVSFQNYGYYLGLPKKVDLDVIGLMHLKMYGGAGRIGLLQPIRSVMVNIVAKVDKEVQEDVQYDPI